ncbi:MAG: DUF86 domain-containing protein [Bacillota bacterium]|nr:DUF86 domain-containing protein [Bacillota bacterium]
MIDKLLVKQRLAFMESYYQELIQLKELPREIFLHSRNSAAAESFLRRSLEAIFDIGRHILAKSGGIEMATEYKSIAKGLMEKNIVDKPLSEKLLKMAGYRNRMVHLYHQISNEELYEIVQDNLGDLKDYIQQVSNFINKNN